MTAKCSPQTISMIIPLYNETDLLESLFAQIDHFELWELILVDGGSTDGTYQACKQYISEHRPSFLITLLCTNKPNRGEQLAAGCKVASGSVLWFFHADSSFPPASDPVAEICDLLQNKDCSGGFFPLAIAEQADSFGYRFAVATANKRSLKLGLIYGDQAIFVRQEVYHAVGGFSPYPLMEDIDLVRRIRKNGLLLCTQREILVSARRWQRKGLLCSIIITNLLVILYYCGVSPLVLAQAYGYRRKC